MRRSFLVLVLVMVCVVGLSACGDDEDDGSTAQGSTTTAATGTAGASRFCELFRSYNDRYSRTTNVTDADERRDLLRGARSDLDKAKDAAPPEVKADTEVLDKVVDEYVDALEDVDYNMSRIPANVAQRLVSPDFLAAAQRTQTYVSTACP